MTFKCNHCGKTFPVTGSFAGHKMHCPKCKEGTLVPSFHEPAPAPAAAAGQDGSPPPPKAKPHPIKRHLGHPVSTDPKAKRSEKIRLALTLLGVVGACGLCIAGLVLYPVLRGPPAEQEKQVPRRVEAKVIDTPKASGEKEAEAPAGEKGSVAEDPAAPGEKTEDKAGPEEGAAPAEEKTAAPAEEKEPAPAEEKEAAAPEDEPAEKEVAPEEEKPSAPDEEKAAETAE